MLTGVSLIALTRMEHPLVRTTRTALTDAVAPILSALNQPVAWGDQGIAWVRGWANTHARNARLERELASLPALQAELVRLQKENAQLRQQISMIPEPAEVRLSTRVVGVSGGAFVRNVIIEGGRTDGLAYGLPVTDSRGVVGRIIEVGARTGRVLLISDLNSRVPVFVGASRMPAIAAGRNRELLALEFLPDRSLPQVGDQVVTSGHGGVFPPGLLVGQVVRVSRSGALVLPAAGLDRLEIVQVRRVLPRGPAEPQELFSGIDEAVQ
ncbi:MAG: rod shape-determining protein MreC [Rhodothalassiaceae bacterium]